MEQFYTNLSGLFIPPRVQRSFLLLAFLFLLPWALRAQVTVTNKGVQITISNGSVYINGSYVNNALAEEADTSIVNAGKLFISDSLVNKSKVPFLGGEGGWVIFNGSREQVIMSPGLVNFHNLRIQKPANNLRLLQAVRVADSLQLVQGNLHLGDYMLDLATENTDVDGSGRIFGEENSRRIFTGPEGRGFISTRLNITNGTTILNPGNLGLQILPGNNTLLGMTQIIRGHGRQMGAGDGGIARYFDVSPEEPSGVDSINFQYLDSSELAGLNESEFSLWYSANRGVIWRSQGGTLDPAENFVGKAAFNFGEAGRLTVGPRICQVNPLVALGEPIIYLCKEKKEEEAESIRLDAGNPGMFYEWFKDGHSTGDFTQTITVNNPGTYKVSVTNANGCVGWGEIEVLLKNKPTASFNFQAGCLGEKTVFKDLSTADEKENLHYLWDFGAPGQPGNSSTEQDPIFLYEAPGNYWVSLVVTSEYGCSNTIRRLVPVYAYPEAAFTYDNACLDNSINFINQSTVETAGALNYHWDFGDGDYSTAMNPSKTYSQAGDYKVKLVVSSVMGCKDSVTHTLSVFEKPLPDFSFNKNICKGENISLINNSVTTGGKLSYFWDFGDGTTSSQARPAKNYAEAGFYTITLTATSSFGCSQSISKEVAINACLGPEPVDCAALNFKVNLGPDRELCPGESLLLDAGTEGIAYRWSDYSTASSLLIDQPGEYWVEMMNEHGCMSKDYIRINSLALDLGNEILFCQGGGLTLDAGNPGSSYHWYSGQGSLGFDRTLEVSRPGTYWVSLSRSGCTLTDTIRVQETSNVMEANFLAASLVDIGDTIEFVQVSFPEPTEFYWSFGNGAYSMEADPSYVYYRAGDYKVMLISSNGVCTDTVSKTITVRPLRREVANPAAHEQALFTEIMLVKTYPNPTQGRLKLEIRLNNDARVEVVVYNMNGVMIDSRAVKGPDIHETFDFSTLGSGMYVMKIMAGQQVKVQRIIKL